MAAVTFGALIDAAEQHIEAARQYQGPVPMNPGELARQLRRLALTVARYLDEPLRRTGLVAVSGPGTDPADRALLELRQALLVTADGFGSLIPDGPVPEVQDPCLRHLTGAADALAAGRDLLATHVATNPDGTLADRSVWAPVLTSRPFVTAVTAEAGRWTGRVLDWTSWLASHGCPVLTDPCGILSHAEAAVQRVAARPGDEETLLLRGIPSATPPPRITIPEHGEPDDVLCEGIAIGAERLRSITFGMPDQAAWSWQISGPAWEHSARAGALICHMSETALAMLLRHTSGQPADAGLSTAIGALADARTAWLRGVECWRLPTTDAPSHVTPVTAEADALVLRTGRLIYAHPRWTPQRSKDIKTRELAGLAPDATVLTALHTASDAIMRMAEADLKTITAALAAQRIFVPSRTVSLSYAAVARRYIRISPDRSGPLLDAYQTIVERSQLAIRALDELALNAGTPSQVLALARRAAEHQHGRASYSGSASDLPYRPGPLENGFRKMGTADPGLLLRANAIDRATRELLADARDAAANPARLAAMDSPQNSHTPAGPSAAKPLTRVRPSSAATPVNTAARRQA
jgi:hypothetical protein